MAEEKKDLILNFLKENQGKRFNMKELCEKIEKISYPSILKWVEVLKAEEKIIVTDYGNVKLVEVT